MNCSKNSFVTISLHDEHSVHVGMSGSAENGAIKRKDALFVRHKFNSYRFSRFEIFVNAKGGKGEAVGNINTHNAEGDAVAFVYGYG